MDLDIGEMMANLTSSAAPPAASVKTQPTYVPAKATVVPAGAAAVAAAPPVAAPVASAPSSGSFFTSPIFLSFVALLVGGIIALVVWQLMSVSTQVKAMQKQQEEQEDSSRRRDAMLRHFIAQQQQQQRHQQAPVGDVENPLTSPEDRVDRMMRLEAEKLRQQQSMRQTTAMDEVKEAEAPAPARRRKRKYASSSPEQETAKPSAAVASSSVPEPAKVAAKPAAETPVRRSSRRLASKKESSGSD